MLVFYKNSQDIGESPVRNEFVMVDSDRGFADTLSIFVKHLFLARPKKGGRFWFPNCPYFPLWL